MSRKKQVGIILGILFASLVLAFLLKPDHAASEKQLAQRNKQLNLPAADATNLTGDTEPKNDPLALATASSATSSEQKKQRVIVLTKEKQAELEGNTHNQYGIRQDILQFIEENVPKDNPKAFEAAIKLAQYENQIYYHAKDQKEALMLVKKNSLASRCLMEAFPNDPTRFVNGVRVKWEWEKIYEGITKRMNDTAARDKHMWDIDETYFSWQLIGTGLTSAEENERCAAGNF